MGVALATIVLGGLELWYRSLLPGLLPQASTVSSPKLVRDAIWIDDCAGNGDPYLRPVYPFLIGSFLAREGPDTSLSAGIARMTLPPPAVHREGNLRRMLRAMALATWVSRHWTPEQALNTYAALAWLGDDRYGVTEGSAFLFGKDITELSVAETALLVATIRSPNRLSPLCHAERALQARNDLLQRMGRAGIIDEKEIAASLAAPLGVRGDCTTS